MTDLFAVIAGGFNAVKKYLKLELETTLRNVTYLSFLSICSFALAGLINWNNYRKKQL